MFVDTTELPAKRARIRETPPRREIVSRPNMARFFRENVLGVFLLSAAGSVLATWLAPYLPNPVSDGRWWRTVFFQPVPALALFPYSFALVWVFAVVTRRWQAEQQRRSSEERKALERQAQLLGDERDALRSQLASTRSSGPRPDLMRFVAIVLSDPAGAEPVTHQRVRHLRLLRVRERDRADARGEHPLPVVAELIEVLTDDRRL